MKTVVVTGGAGFIGSHVVDAFVANDYSVIIYDLIKPDKKHRNKKALYRICDLKNREKTSTLLLKDQPDVISHHASSQVNVFESLLSPQRVFEDLQMTANVFEPVKKARRTHLIFSSSANVYASSATCPIGETEQVAPQSPYGISKVALESYCQYLTSFWQTPCTIFRYFNVYGPRQNIKAHAGIVPILIVNGLKKRTIPIFGNGHQVRDFIFVKDVADVNIVAAKQGLSGIFNIGSEKPTSINTLIAHISRLLDTKLKVMYKRKPSGIIISYANTKKIQKITRWNAKTNLDDGLEQTIRYFQTL